MNRLSGTERDRPVELETSLDEGVDGISNGFNRAGISFGISTGGIKANTSSHSFGSMGSPSWKKPEFKALRIFVGGLQRPLSSGITSEDRSAWGGDNSSPGGSCRKSTSKSPSEVSTGGNDNGTSLPPNSRGLWVDAEGALMVELDPSVKVDKVPFGVS